MAAPRQTRSSEQRGPILLAFAIIGIAITGYYVGLTSPMPNRRINTVAIESVAHRDDLPPDEPAAVIPATSYSDMTVAETGPNRDWTTRLAMLKQDPYDPFAEIELDPQQKLTSLARRDELRAFNGAPPTIPHSIEQMTSRGCMVCHGGGIRAQSLRAAKMPHPFYANCTQCHVEQNAQFVLAFTFRENEFDGLPAPRSGPRAFEIAPPMLPHTTWLRDDCLSCHGRTASPGMETTHPWRQNCLQCHAPSSQMEQMQLAATPGFLPPPLIEDSDE